MPRPKTDMSDFPTRRRLQTLDLQRPRCPVCHDVRLIKYRSLTDQGDGSALWWVRCGDDDCSHRFRIRLT